MAGTGHRGYLCRRTAEDRWRLLVVRRRNPQLVLSGPPKCCEIDLDRVERLRAHDVEAREYAEEGPFRRFEAEYLERPERGIDDPGVAHARTRVDRQLHLEIESGGRGGEDLAGPIRR